METPRSRRRASGRVDLASIGDDGSRVAIHPADVSGRFTLWRRLSAIALIAVYVLLPWIQVRGKPAVFLDVARLRFHCFGFTFAADDLWLVFFLITGLGFALFFVTALFGRLWCGWTCPQTVFLEHVYRRIERWLEGDATARRRLDREPWGANKALRRGAKHVLFVLVSLAIAHVLLAYFVSIPEVWKMVSHAPGEHWGVFVFIIVASALLYFNFAWFREQLCIILCPYGRLQSALIDDDSVVIGYDTARGEPRGPMRASAADVGEQGDCVDCLRCVQVCPTGIDIRQGLQLECIGCAACIDACDRIMDRVGRPRGLIRYDSMNAFAGGTTRFLRPRVWLYSALLVIGAATAAVSFLRYQPADFTVVRMQGSPYFVDADVVRNQFLVRVINKRDEPASFSLRVVPEEPRAPAFSIAGWDEALVVEAGGEQIRPLVVTVPREEYAGRFAFRIDILNTTGAVVSREAAFVGPDPELLKAHAAPPR